MIDKYIHENDERHLDTSGHKQRKRKEAEKNREKASEREREKGIERNRERASERAREIETMGEEKKHHSADYII